MKRNFCRDVAAEVVGSILGAFILSILFFISSDFIFKAPNLNGKWYFALETHETSYSKYKDMKVYYLVFLRQEEQKIFGTGEKIMEDIDGNRTHYQAKNRVKIEIRGYIDRNYLSKDKLVIHYTEEGKRRESSSYQTLVRYDDRHMSGEFDSSIANSSGLCVWDRQLDEIHFSGSVEPIGR